jgi:hypothetical protein
VFSVHLFCSVFLYCRGSGRLTLDLHFHSPIARSHNCGWALRKESEAHLPPLNSDILVTRPGLVSPVFFVLKACLFHPSSFALFNDVFLRSQDCKSVVTRAAQPSRPESQIFLCRPFGQGLLGMTECMPHILHYGTQNLAAALLSPPFRHVQIHQPKAPTPKSANLNGKVDPFFQGRQICCTPDLSFATRNLKAEVLPRWLLYVALRNCHSGGASCCFSLQGQSKGSVSSIHLNVLRDFSTQSVCTLSFFLPLWHLFVYVTPSQFVQSS